MTQMKATDFIGKKVDVLGFGKSNIPLVEWLLSHGAFITVRDSSEFEALSESKNGYVARGVKFVCGKDKYLCDIDGDYVFRTPGINPTKPEIQKAVEGGSVLTSEMELFFDLCPCKIIGVTGSDGKTTTTTVIEKCLEKAFGEEKVFVGGNIGAPLLPELDRMTPDCFAVVELSSFQLFTMKKSPDYSIITNISPNHLDYHRDMQEYIDAKSNIFLHQHGGRTVLNSKNEETKKLIPLVPKDTELLTFVGSGTENINGTIYRNGVPYLDTKDIYILGDHNVENYEGVIALIGDVVSREVIVDVAKNFHGVSHRIEFVAKKNGVSYYDSSIDSCPSRTTAALLSFDDDTDVTIIVGGRNKNVSLEPLCDVLCKKAKRVVLTGELMQPVYDEMQRFNSERKPELYCEFDFTKAVLKSAEVSKPGDVVLLSPGGTSFDAFKNYCERGDRFCEIVKSL